MKNVSKILWGLVLIILGFLIALNQLGLADVNLFFDGWWTLFIIVPCAIELISGKDRMGSLTGLLIGIILLLAAQDFISFNLIWKLIFPFILVMIGLSIVCNELFGYKVKEKVSSIKMGSDDVVATFGEEIKNIEGEFEGTNVEAIFGHVLINLKKAKLTKDSAIKANAIFGSVDIVVPTDAIVKVKSTKIFGGVDNFSSGESTKKKEEKIIYVEALALFGGITIK